MKHKALLTVGGDFAEKMPVNNCKKNAEECYQMMARLERNSELSDQVLLGIIIIGGMMYIIFFITYGMSHLKIGIGVGILYLITIAVLAKISNGLHRKSRDTNPDIKTMAENWKYYRLQLELVEVDWEKMPKKANALQILRWWCEAATQEVREYSERRSLYWQNEEMDEWLKRKEAVRIITFQLMGNIFFECYQGKLLSYFGARKEFLARNPWTLVM